MLPDRAEHTETLMSQLSAHGPLSAGLSIDFSLVAHL